MHLYRHSIECQSAIQMFLDENPRYWRFVPMTNEEADQAEENIVIATMDFKSTDIKDDEKIKLFIKNLPPPPPDYRFSMRQYYLQYAYFKSRRHESIPNEHLDLYNAKVIAVCKCFLLQKSFSKIFVLDHRLINNTLCFSLTLST